MANFAIFADSTTAQALASAETGFIGSEGYLFVAAAPAVTIAGPGSSLTVMGTVATAVGSAAVATSSTVSSAYVTVGAQGAILSTQSAAMNVAFSSLFQLTSAGLIAGQSGIVLRGSTGFESANISNTGTILSNGFDSAGLSGFAALSADAAVSTLTLSNGGRIEATLSGIGVNHQGTGFLNLVNTGTIASQGAAIRTASALQMDNTGTVNGGITFGTYAILQNAGLIAGDITDTVTGDSVASRIENAGRIIGDIRFGDGADIYRSLGGTVTGTIFGGGGNDTYYIDASDTRISDSGGATDQVFSEVDYRMAAGIEVLTLTGRTGLQGWGTAGNESIFGGDGDDTLHGRGGNDRLGGGDGENVLHGGSGDDTFILSGENALCFGGTGSDTFAMVVNGETVDGGSSVDIVSFAGSSAAIAIDLQLGTVEIFDSLTGAARGTAQVISIEQAALGSGNDSVVGSDGDNLILVSSGNDAASGGGGNDAVAGGAGLDTLSGDDGNDTLFGEGDGDEILGGAGIDTLYGGDGNDSLYGGNDADRLFGEAGSDALFGDSGADTLIGAAGADTMTGGLGADTFAFSLPADSTPAARDRIEDFELLRDLIDLSAIDASALLGGDNAFTFLGQGTFTGTAGEIRFNQSVGSNTTIIQIRLEGSVTNDMAIEIAGLLVLTADNFVL